MKKVLIGVVIVVLSFVVMPISTVSAQDACEGNFDYDKDVDGTDASVFKEDFGRSAFSDPCPPNGPAPIPMTGQLNSDEPYDDGYYTAGVTWYHYNRFTDNLDGTVTDNLTGLIWLKNAYCFTPRSWYDALDAAHNLYDGATPSDCALSDGSEYRDWRLPNVNELSSLIDRSKHDPALPDDHPFVAVIYTLPYWTSTTADSYAEMDAWHINLKYGKTDFDDKYYEEYLVWPVRGGRGLDH